MVEWLNDNQGATTAFLTFFLVALTAYYAFQTRRQVEVIFQPRVYAEFALAQNKWAVVVQFHNSGGSMATNIELLINPGLKPSDDVNITKMEVPSLIPGQTLHNFIGFSDNYLKQGIKYVNFILRYKDNSGKEYSFNYDVNLIAILRVSVPNGVGFEDELYHRHLIAVLTDISESLKRIEQKK